MRIEQNLPVLNHWFKIAEGFLTSTKFLPAFLID